LPKSNTEYWLPKLANNKKRDKKNRSRLARLGWKCLVIWDCQTVDGKKLKQQLKAFLNT
jgi:DNA mismatch endonuclease (patch repair protein)